MTTSKDKIPKLPTSYDYHRYFTFQDPIFKRHANRLRIIYAENDLDEATKYTDAVARQRKIAFDDVVAYIKGGVTDENPPITTGARFTVNSDGKLAIELDDNATRAEVLDAFKAFDKYRKEYLSPEKKKRRQTPRDLELLFAIERMLQNRKSWDEIFQKYEEGSLPKSGSNYDTKYELQAYFYDNRLV